MLFIINTSRLAIGTLKKFLVLLVIFFGALLIYSMFGYKTPLLLILSLLFFLGVGFSNVSSYIVLVKTSLNYRETLILTVLGLCGMDEEEDNIIYEGVLGDVIVLFYSFLISGLFFIYPNKQVDLFWLVILSLSLNLTVLLYYSLVYGVRFLNSKLEWCNWGVSNLLFPYLELFSLLFKILNTGFRLYSNFLAGHLIIILLYYLNMFLFSVADSLVITVAALICFFIYYAVNLLEVMLAFIQYYVFILLNGMFCSDSH